MTTTENTTTTANPVDEAGGISKAHSARRKSKGGSAPKASKATPKAKKPAAKKAAKPKAKKAAKPKAAKKSGAPKQPRIEVYGHSATSVVRTMGTMGFTAAEATHALGKLIKKGPMPAQPTIRAQLTAVDAGRGEPAKLTVEQRSELSALKAEAKKVLAAAKAKKAA